jgi:hypothetical protein
MDASIYLPREAVVTDEKDAISDLKTDVALIKQEMHYFREQLKSFFVVFRWFITAVVAALGTAVFNFIANGGLKL